MDTLHDDIKCSFTTIPFKSSLSFEYLLEKIEKIAQEPGHVLFDSAQKILKDLKKVPQLMGTIDDFNLVKKNRGLVNRLMSFVFNPFKDEIEASAACAPFYPKPFYSTSLFDQLMRGDHKKLEMDRYVNENNMLLAVIYQAYLIILIKFYSQDFNFDLPFHYRLTNQKTNTVKYLKMLVDPSYTGIKVKGKLNKLSEKDIKELLNNASDLDFWNEKIPLHKFEFTGFLQFSYIDVTHETIISQLKSDLLDKHTIISQAGFDRIRQKIRTLMEIPDLEFGMAAFGDFETTIDQNVIWRSIIPQTELACDEYAGTLYESAYRQHKMMFTSDFKELEESKIASLFLKRGIRNHVIIPLSLEDEIVGMMEFGAKKPDQINRVQIKRLYDLFPMFAIALKRSKEELNDRIRAIIQEECTAIHPTVEWRFRQAASNMLVDNLKGEGKKMEHIIFPNIIPVYGATDIRNSSVERNRAIQSDLVEHLNLAKELLITSMINNDMPLLDHLVYKTDKQLDIVNSGLKAGDEVSILEFLRKDIEPVFAKIRERDIKLGEKVDKYFSKMDPELGVLYKKRKNFEDSLTEINDCVGEIIDEEQLKAQQVFPHYFEKYRTDGVEYNAYIGQSLVRDLTYDPIYLKNLRLWQLLVKVKVARKVRELIPSLKTKLDVTQLILVHSNPLSIAFRQDEKKFDVAGAYNIRYEITKKRIDKAVIKGTSDRITQVGKIAIIYAHAEEVEEYKRYIDYLIAKNLLKGSIEDFELEDLKGASGLRALRVEVNFTDSSQIEDVNISEIKKLIEK